MTVTSRQLARCLNIADLRKQAARRLPLPVFDFLEGGAEDEATVRRNREAFAEWALIPRSLRDVSRVNASAKVMGIDLEWPLLIGPTGMPGLFHPDGELGLARAAAATGALYCLSTMSTRSIEEVAACTDAPKAFQLYVFRDRELTRELLVRARDAGYAALVLTVDIQVAANRERDRRTGMTVPPSLGLRSMMHFARRPLWCWDHLVRRPITLANFSGKRAEPGSTLLGFINSQFEPSLSWRGLEWVASQWNGPLAVKGILRSEDARQAAAHGASAVILSNHGGRQMDCAVSGLDVLAETVDHMQGAADVILDGGIRRGTDMVKAMSLGAAACMTGRVGLYGLTAGGEAGATHALRLLRGEYERDLALLGVPDGRDLDRSCVRRTGGR